MGLFSVMVGLFLRGGGAKSPCRWGTESEIYNIDALHVVHEGQHALEAGVGLGVLGLEVGHVVKHEVAVVVVGGGGLLVVDVGLDGPGSD